MEHLRGDVSTKETPVWTVGSRADVVLVAVDDMTSGEFLRAVRKNGTELDELFVGEGVIGNENGGCGADCKGDDGAILDFEVL